ncbi:TlpA family protein disulfide reductase [Guggenheimella bovis]
MNTKTKRKVAAVLCAGALLITSCAGTPKTNEPALNPAPSNESQASGEPRVAELPAGEPKNESGLVFSVTDPVTKEQKGQPEILSKDINIVIIWQTTCPPCRQESAVIEKVYKEFPDINIVGIGLAQNEDELQKAINEWGLTYKNYFATDQFITSLAGKVTNTPTVLFLDKVGREIAPKQEGYRYDAEQKDAALEQFRQTLKELSNAKK